MVTAAITATSCTSGNEVTTSAVEVLDSAGVEIVRNTYRAIDTLSALLEEDFRIGTREGAVETQFHLISGLARDQIGRIFVVDQGSQAVRVYGQDGGFIRRFGGPGNGPGEFTAITGLFVWHDTVHVRNASAPYTGTLFDTTGLLLTTYRSRLQDGSQITVLAGGPRGWLVADDSLLALRARATASTPIRTTFRIGRVVPAALPTLAESRANVDSLVMVITTMQGGRLFRHVATEGSASSGAALMSSPLFEPDPSRAIDGHGSLYVAPGWPYVVDVYDQNGAHSRRITRAHDSIPVTDELVERLLNRAQDNIDTRTSANAGRARSLSSRSQMPSLGFIPPVGALRVSDDGWLWVLRQDVVPDPVELEWTINAPSRPSHWDVFDRSGRYRYTVTTPPRFAAVIVDSAGVIGIERDDLDVQYVVRYNLKAVQR